MHNAHLNVSVAWSTSIKIQEIHPLLSWYCDAEAVAWTVAVAVAFNVDKK